MAETNNILFEDRFIVDEVDKGGKKFDRVSRIEATSQNLRMSLVLDIANELYPLKPRETFTLALARSLLSEGEQIDGDADLDGEENGVAGGGKKVKRELWRGGDQGLADDYEYVMYGKIYKYDDSTPAQGNT
ncbi:DNA-directed RNA polymerase I, II, and III subunit RPABC3 [Tremella mesenterica]|uniref:DNA-directed RNA polymerases I, II, and III subunit RPABC3 n=1 Tax=Tremella mesenterica TaxID=5217 RepID=A0A4Q1BFE4_TREME|nr:DNA-directed RNA polymerase I, II, and III subunit RPABC3 [Tremella mesenterica]